jgi:tyrosine-protein kinase Etk/Wzc
MTPEMKAVEQVRAEAPASAPGSSAASAPVSVAVPPIPDSDERSPAQLFWTLFQARVVISAITVGFVVLGAVYMAVATPIYRSDLILQVEESTKGIAGLSEVSALLADKAPSDTEMEILRSRSLVGSVVDELNLEVEARPRRFPLLGFMAARYRGSIPAPPFLGLSSYAWGGERIQLQRLQVGEALLNKKLLLIAGERGRFEVRGPDGEHLLDGAVETAAAGGKGDARVEMFVSELLARPGTRFRVTQRTRGRVIGELQDDLRISEKGKKTGILVVALEGPDPEKAAAILNAVGATYVRQNVERKSAEAAKTLEFLETQLPTLKANLDAAEAALKGYQVQKGTLDLSREATAMLTRSVEIEKALSEAELQRSDLRQKFTDSHPALLSLSDKIEKLRADRAAMNARMRDLPGTELDSARLTRDVKVSGELYNVLLNKAQELRVVKSGTIGNVRILDRASVPDLPVSPKSAPVLLLSLVLGLTLGVAVAFTRKSIYAGLDDPQMVEHVTGVTVYATVPRSAKQASLERGGGRGALPLLATVAPDDPAVESIRSLRTGLQFSLLEARNNVILITGPTARVGKSFVTVNLAHVMASAGQRVLIIDGDLRRGRVHRFFGGERHPGLTDVLGGAVPLADAIRKSSSSENLDWLPTGRIPPNPAELLGSERFGRLLSELSARYDLVVIDTAPVLPVTDAALVGRLAGTTLLVLRAGAHPVPEVLMAVKRLGQSGVRVQGAVFNDVSGAGARYSRYGYQYRYDSRA